MAVNEDGKYTKLTPETIKLLEEAFAMDCPIVEAILHANISYQTYYNWIEKNPKMKERFEELRNRPYLLARTTINKAIQENPQYAFEYMKRKKRKEFGDNVDLTTKGDKVMPILGGQSNVHNDNGDQSPITTEEKN
jgi:hypothetical protein